jgi:HK97 family phage portal protein
VNIFGLSITRKKALPGSSYAVTQGSGGWMPLIREPFTGAWQRNQEITVDTALTYSTVFSCVSLIAGDISKLRPRLMELDPSTGIWTEVAANSPFWPVIRKPNRYQTRNQFWANWMQSKLIHGNTYVLKQRDQRGIITALYILDPTRVTVLCTAEGTVFYELRTDHLSGIQQPDITVPASEIIHDNWNTFYHPLVGVSPITAAAIAAAQGLEIQKNSTKFFAAGAQPGGILVAPTGISEEKALRLQQQWNDAYGPQGRSRGHVAVIGGDMKYIPMVMTSVDSQLIEQLKWTAESVISVFHVPAYKVGVAPAPTYNNIEALNQAYYSDCLQKLIEDAETLLDEGLELPTAPRRLGVGFDTDSGLFRMDTASRVRAAKESIDSGAISPDEARNLFFGLGPVEGGDTPYMQQQQFSLRALAERDQDKPFAKPAAPSAPPPAQDAETEDDGGSADDTRNEGGVAARALAHEWIRRSQPHYVRPYS